MDEQEPDSEVADQEIADQALNRYAIAIALAVTFVLFGYAIYMLIYDLINY